MRIACITALSMSCGATERPTQPEAAPALPDILLVTLDTARADRFGPDSPVDTPAYDRVAAAGVRFTTAVAPAPITLVSHASLFTGQRPPTHGVRNNGVDRLPAEAQTLAETLRAAGYRTGAFVGAAVLDADYGLSQGFDHYDDDTSAAGGTFGYARRSGAEVVAAASAWLAGADARPQMAWVHLFDAHAPYAPPEPERSRYADSAYNGAVASADRAVAQLLDAHARLNRGAPAIIITADHGESLGEHGERTHGVFVYDSTMRIPLVMAVPGWPGGTQVDEQVRLVDVAPSLLARLGLPPLPDADGVDLHTAVGGTRALPPLAYVETLLPLHNYGWAPSRGMRSATHKRIEGARVERFDLSTDPGELHDLPSPPTEDIVLATALAAIPPLPIDAQEIDPAVASQLAALGYVWTEPTDGPLPDPHERIHLGERLAEASAAWARGEHAAAIAAYEAVLAEDTTNVKAMAQLSQMYWETDQISLALASWQRASQLAPTDPSFLDQIGAAHERIGDTEQALRSYAGALEIDPDYADARAHRWRLLRRLGDTAAFDRELTDAAAQRPTDPLVLTELGDRSLRSGDVQGATQSYRQALEAAPDSLRPALRLARIALSEDRPRDAVALLAPLQATPAVIPALAEAYARSGDPGHARALLDPHLARHPDDGPAWLISGVVHLQAGDTKQGQAHLMRAEALGQSGPMLDAALRR